MNEPTRRHTPGKRGMRPHGSGIHAPADTSPNERWSTAVLTAPDGDLRRRPRTTTHFRIGDLERLISAWIDEYHSRVPASPVGQAARREVGDGA